MEEKTDLVKKGVRLSVLSGTVLVVAILLSLLLLRSVSLTAAGYRALQEDTTRYVDSRQDAADMRAGSDYLTEQVRAFTVTGDPVRVENFFTELEQTRRRDRALESLDRYFSGTETYRFLSEAMDRSNELVDVEYYAMRLAIEGYGYAAADYPEALQQVELSREDLALTPQQQVDKARGMVFDEQYQSYKDAINENINRCLETLIGDTEQQRLRSDENFRGMLRRQQITDLVYLVMVVLFVALMGFFDHPPGEALRAAYAPAARRITPRWCRRCWPSGTACKAFERKERSMKLKVVLDEGARMPLRAHPFDAGMDLYTREEKLVPARGSAVLDTGVHVEIPEGYVGFIKSKSGLNVKHDIQAEGVIDAGYTGPIVVKVYNHGAEDFLFHAGDKLTQLVILPVALPELEQADSLESTERGDGGFGSTGR